MNISVREGSSNTTVSLKGRFDFQAHMEFRRTVEGLLRAGLQAAP